MIFHNISKFLLTSLITVTRVFVLHTRNSKHIRRLLENLSRWLPMRPTWEGKRLSATDLIEIFISKTKYFTNYWRCFSGITQYPQMVMWLDREEEAPSDLEV